MQCLYTSIYLKTKGSRPDRDNTSDFFYYSISILNNTPIVSTMYDEHDLNGNNPIENAGSAYIFEYNNHGNWDFL